MWIVWNFSMEKQIVYGEGAINLFDLVVVDLCWWRNTKKMPIVKYEIVKIK